MKQDEVVIGREYICRTGDHRIRVRVVARVEMEDFFSHRATTRFRVARVDNGREMPKLRHASALHVPGYLDY